jgi:hypothetical protein
LFVSLKSTRPVKVEHARNEEGCAAARRRRADRGLFVRRQHGILALGRREAGQLGAAPVQVPGGTGGETAIGPSVSATVLFKWSYHPCFSI